MAEQYSWKALSRYDRGITTVIAENAEAAKQEIERSLTKNPSRRVYFEEWVEAGKALRLADYENAKKYKPQTTDAGRDAIFDLVHDHGDPSVLVHRVSEGNCPVCGHSLVVPPGTYEDDRVIEIKHWCPNPGCGVGALDLVPIVGGDWAVAY